MLLLYISVIFMSPVIPGAWRCRETTNSSQEWNITLLPGHLTGHQGKQHFLVITPEWSTPIGRDCRGLALIGQDLQSVEIFSWCCSASSEMSYYRRPYALKNQRWASKISPHHDLGSLQCSTLPQSVLIQLKHKTPHKIVGLVQWSLKVFTGVINW